MEPAFGTTTVQTPILYTRSEKQGSTDATRKFNATISRCMVLAIRACEANDLGIVVEGARFTHVLWCDNVYLLARDWEILRKMTNILSTELQTSGLYWKPSSLEYMTSSPNAPAFFEISAEQPDVAQVALKVPRVSVSTQLGSVLTQTGDSTPDVEARISVAWPAWWGDKALRKKTLSMLERVRRYEQHAQPILLY
eukprot:9008355-Pyramimonas_sp.AAC.1